MDRVVVQWKPHACISSGQPDKDGQFTTLGPNTLTATMSATTRVGVVVSLGVVTNSALPGRLFNYKVSSKISCLHCVLNGKF